MYLTGKRIKLSQSANLKSENNSSAANFNSIDSAYHSHADSTSECSLKQKSIASRQASKLSFDSVDLQQSSSGYSSSSLFSPSSSTLSHNRTTPKKRKSEVSDENAFYNSYQFVSPLKIRNQDPKRPKLILKEKCSSENVILSSTPIRTSNKTKLWGKFRSFHPEKLDSGKSFDDFLPPPKVEESFECLSSFDCSGSFNITDKDNNSNVNIPSDLQKLWSDPIKAPETVTKPQEETPPTHSVSNLSSGSASSVRHRFFGGRKQLDIIGRLHKQQNLALNLIFTHLSDVDLLSLSHVSKDYREMIKSHKTLETKRQNYLKARQTICENLVPGEVLQLSKVQDKKAGKEKKRKFGDANANHSMKLRPKVVLSPPVSPSRKKFHENQKVAKSHSGLLKKCPLCLKPARISTIKIRSSPRKKKSNILKLSATMVSSGRVQKRSSKTFLAKPSNESQILTEKLYTTLPMIEEQRASSSSCGSPSSDESSGSSSETHETELYEYAECSSASCFFKFCVKCNCKYHPRKLCKELSPASPSRGSYRGNSSNACSKQSLKSLKRLDLLFT